MNDNGNGISDIINIYWDEYNKKFRLFGLDIERISSYINHNMNFGFSTDNNLYEVNKEIFKLIDFLLTSEDYYNMGISAKKCQILNLERSRLKREIDVLLNESINFNER